MAQKRHRDYCDVVIKDSEELRVRSPANHEKPSHCVGIECTDVCKPCLKQLVEGMC